MKIKTVILSILLFCVIFTFLSCGSRKGEAAVTDSNGNVISDVENQNSQNYGQATSEKLNSDNTLSRAENGSDTLSDPKYFVTYEQYHAMSESEQIAHFESFASVKEFFSWYNAAKAAYEETREKAEELTGDIDLGG